MLSWTKPCHVVEKVHVATSSGHPALVSFNPNTGTVGTPRSLRQIVLPSEEEGGKGRVFAWKALTEKETSSLKATLPLLRRLQLFNLRFKSQEVRMHRIWVQPRSFLVGLHHIFCSSNTSVHMNI